MALTGARGVSRRAHATVALLVACTAFAGALPAQQPASPVTARGDTVSIHLVDADLRAAVQALAPYLDRPLVFGSAVPAVRVTLETPHAVARGAVRGLLDGMLASQNLELVTDTTAGLYRLQPKAPPAPAAPAPTAVGAARGAAPTGPVQLFVIRLRHARAADVAATVNALYGRASALGEPGAASAAAARSPTLGQQLEQNRVAPVGTPAAAPEAVPGTAGRAATFSGDVVIVPDPRSNSLLVRASAGDFALVRAAVAELDTRPLEVLIEVVIAEVQRNSSLDFGVTASVPPQTVGGGQTTVSGSQAGIGVTDFVLQVMHLGHIDLDATLNAAAAKGSAKILSRPIVLAANNEEATLTVGSQRPFVQVARTLPTDNGVRDQVVQYKDVGTKLTVIPTISPDGYVSLAVTQEVDNATNEVAFDAPVISTRSVQTTLLIKDGQTVALGGLVDKEHTVEQGGVPLLSGIPLIGGLFGHASRQTTETELYLFLTPHVIRTDAEADSVTAPLKDRTRSMTP